MYRYVFSFLMYQMTWLYEDHPTSYLQFQLSTPLARNDQWKENTKSDYLPPTYFPSCLASEFTSSIFCLVLTMYVIGHVLTACLLCVCFFFSDMKKPYIACNMQVSCQYSCLLSLLPAMLFALTVCFPLMVWGQRVHLDQLENLWMADSWVFAVKKKGGFIWLYQPTPVYTFSSLDVSGGWLQTKMSLLVQKKVVKLQDLPLIVPGVETRKSMEACLGSQLNAYLCLPAFSIEVIPSLQASALWVTVASSSA